MKAEQGCRLKRVYVYSPAALIVLLKKSLPSRVGLRLLQLERMHLFAFLFTVDRLPESTKWKWFAKAKSLAITSYFSRRQIKSLAVDPQVLSSPNTFFPQKRTGPRK
ncbi:MAG TPA: hypothetical protein VGN44_03375 [Candidatus Angelobacter sp.]|jgi:hypothetical protein